MKKLLGILVLGLLLSNSAFADDIASGYEDKSDFKNNVADFNKWLHDNGHHQYLIIKTKEICKTLEKGSQPWYDNKCNAKAENNLKIKFYKNRWQVRPNAEPNRDTLIYYLWKTINHPYSFSFHTYEIKPSKEPYEFKSNLRNDESVKKELKKSAILSYLLFEDDKIVIDEKSPKERLGEFFDDETKFRSNSVGKSMIGLLAGHAICAGYIDSIDSKLNDWPLIEKTLYHDQKLIDLLNMKAGDHKHVTDVAMWDGTSNDDENLARYMHMMKDKKKSKPKYNYHGLLPNIVFNYIKHKIYMKHKRTDQFEKFLEDVFQRHIKIKNSVLFFKSKEMPDAGKANSMFYADRYDYLRIAKSIMDDYQNNTCVGKYFKDIHERRIKKKTTKEFRDPPYNPSNAYGGYFHMEYKGLEDRVVFGMSGYGGVSLLIAPETSTITVINSLHYSSKKKSKFRYNEKILSLNPIKDKK